MNPLSETRKADRAEMVRRVSRLAQRHGARVEKNEILSNTRCTLLEITTPCGIAVDVGFDGDSPQPNIFVGTFRAPAGQILSAALEWIACPAFAVQGHNLRSRKANYVAEGFPELLNLLDGAFALAASGGAVRPESPEKTA